MANVAVCVAVQVQVQVPRMCGANTGGILAKNTRSLMQIAKLVSIKVPKRDVGVQVDKRLLFTQNMEVLKKMYIKN